MNRVLFIDSTFGHDLGATRELAVVPAVGDRVCGLHGGGARPVIGRMYDVSINRWHVYLGEPA